MVTTTQGFDALVQLSHGMINRALFALFDSGIIPDHWQPLPGQPAPIEGLEIWFGAPTGRVRTRNGLDVWIEFGQPYTLRAATIENEIKSKYSVWLPVTLADHMIGSGQVQVVRCDCSGLTVDDIDLGLEPSFLQLAALGIIHSMLVQQVEEFPLSAPLIGAMRLSMEAREKQDYISVYANIDGRPGPLTGPSKMLVPSASSSKQIDAAVAIDQSIYLPRIRAAVAAAGLVKGKVIDFPDIVVDDGLTHDNVLRKVTLTKNITVDVVEGAIKVSGGVSADVSNIFDPSANFVLKFGLFANGNTVTAALIDSDIDLDSTIIAILSGVLFGPLALVIAPVIESALEVAIEDAIPEISQSFDLPVQSLFVSGAEITNGATSAATTAVLVSMAGVSVKADCIVLSVAFTYQYIRAERHLPPYFRLNSDTFEFHQAGCRFGDGIGKKRLRFAATAEHALALGYDGCRNCLLLYDGVGTGEVTISYVRPANGKKQRAEPAKFTATYAGKSPLVQFAKPWEVTGNYGPAKDDQFRDSFSGNLLAPGLWTLTITDGDWTASRNFAVNGGQHKSHKFAYQQG